MTRWLAPLLALGVLAWSGTTRAQVDADPPRYHPIFGVVTASGEIGANPAVGAKAAVFASPFSFSGLSLGGSAFFAPLTSVSNTCAPPCTANPRLFRAMAEFRLGSPYRDYARGLAWIDVSAGIAYLTEPGIDPSPSVAVSGGGDLRLARFLWLEVDPRVTWAQLIGHGSNFAGTYFTIGFDVGLRFDFVH